MMKKGLLFIALAMLSAHAFADQIETIIKPFSGTIEVLNNCFTLTNIEIITTNQFQDLKDLSGWPESVQAIPLSFVDKNSDGKNLTFASESTITHKSYFPSTSFNNCGFKLILTGVTPQGVTRSLTSTVAVQNREICASEEKLAEMIRKNVSETPIIVTTAINSDYLMIVNFFDDYYWEQHGRGGRSDD